MSRTWLPDVLYFLWMGLALALPAAAAGLGSAFMRERVRPELRVRLLLSAAVAVLAFPIGRHFALARSSLVQEPLEEIGGMVIEGLAVIMASLCGWFTLHVRGRELRGQPPEPRRPRGA